MIRGLPDGIGPRQKSVVAEMIGARCAAPSRQPPVRDVRGCMKPLIGKVSIDEDDHPNRGKHDGVEFT